MESLTTRAELDNLVQAMAHWLTAAEATPGDRAASTQALDEARRRLQAHRESTARQVDSSVV
jgi:hypothetical protein